MTPPWRAGGIHTGCRQAARPTVNAISVAPPIWTGRKRVAIGRPGWRCAQGGDEPSPPDPHLAQSAWSRPRAPGGRSERDHRHPDRARLGVVLQIEYDGTVILSAPGTSPCTPTATSASRRTPASAWPRRASTSTDPGASVDRNDADRSCGSTAPVRVEVEADAFVGVTPYLPRDLVVRDAGGGRFVIAGTYGFDTFRDDTFVLLIDGQPRTFRRWEDIPEVFDNVIHSTPDPPATSPSSFPSKKAAKHLNTATGSTTIWNPGKTDSGPSWPAKPMEAGMPAVTRRGDADHPHCSGMIRKEASPDTYPMGFRSHAKVTGTRPTRSLGCRVRPTPRPSRWAAPPSSSTGWAVGRWAIPSRDVPRSPRAPTTPTPGAEWARIRPSRTCSPPTPAASGAAGRAVQQPVLSPLR